MKNIIQSLIILSTVFGIALIVSSCTSASRSKLGSYGSPHKVELFSGGVKIGEWVSKGKVLSEDNSDGYYFEEKDTGQLREVAGTIIITRL